MRKEFITKSYEAAKFHFQAYRFLNDLTLLMDAIGQELRIQGYSLGAESYYLSFLWIDNQDFSAQTGSGRFRMTQEFHGRFYENRSQGAELVHYVYGILLRGNQDPESISGSWIPYIYFMKAKLISVMQWDHWKWSRRLAETKEMVDSISANLRYISSIKPSEVNSGGVNHFV
jgi:hypothetical protein